MSEERKHAGGAPVKYTEEMIERGYKLSLLGLDNEKIAFALGISHGLFYNWQNDYPEFLEAIKAGKDDADADVVVSLYERARGYEHKEEKIFCSEGQIIRAETTKKYPPDTKAAEIILRNRHPELWNKQGEVNVTGSMSITRDFGDTEGDGEDGRIVE